MLSLVSQEQNIEVDYSKSNGLIFKGVSNGKFSTIPSILPQIILLSKAEVRRRGGIRLRGLSGVSARLLLQQVRVGRHQEERTPGHMWWL